MQWKFELTLQAHQQFKKLEPDFKERIKTKLGFWQSQKDPLFFSRPMVNFQHATHRYRIGKYRIIIKAEYEKRILLIVKIALRDSVYR